MNASNRFPIVKPEWESYPWAFAFSTISYEEGEVYNFKSSVCEENRIHIQQAMNIPSLAWLSLNHGNNVLTVPEDSNDCFADAAVISSCGYAAAITTADCLPVVILSPSSKTIAVVHCGWKGLVNEILEKTVTIMSSNNSLVLDDIMVWVGPSVRNDYEIREDVRIELLESNNVTGLNFTPIEDGKFLADIPGILIQKMFAIGINPKHIFFSPESTISSPRFFSVRREGQATGRIATIVGLV